jgi:protein O-mannosyl-transferase
MISVKNRPNPKYLVCLFLVVITLLSYWQLPTHDFLNFDDNVHITQSINVHKGITWKNIAWAFSFTDIAYWHPLTWLSHMLTFQLFGLNSGMHHLANLFLHVANTLLLFFVLHRMTRSLWSSAFVAAMFALHPLNVESVAWASERKNVLSTFFWMLTMLAYVCYAERPTLLRYLLTFLVFALGLMAKPMLVTLPFVLLLLDYWPLYRLNLSPSKRINQEHHKSKNAGFQRSTFLRLVLEKIPLLVLSIITIYLSSMSVQGGRYIISTALVPMKLRVANALVSYVSYIKKMIWPHNLTIYYPYPHALPMWQVAGAGLLLFCISCLVLKALKSKPYLVVGWLWYIGTLVPVIGLVQAGLWPATADRFAYVPLIGLFIVIAWCAPDFVTRWRSRKIVLVTLATTLISILTVTTWLQLKYWQNGVTLFTHSLKATPNNSLINKELGNALEDQGNFDKAMYYYAKAIQITPNFAEPHNNLGRIFALKKDYKDAIYHYNEALRIKPTFTEAHNNLATALLYQGNEKEAIYHYYEALRSNPNYAGAYYNLAKIYANQGKTEKTIILYRKALDCNPEMIQALYNLSWINATHENEKYRNGEKAIELAEKLSKITQYNHPMALDALAAAYAETGKFDTAVLTAEKGLELAKQQGPKELAFGLKNRLELYKKGQPYRQYLSNKNES